MNSFDKRKLVLAGSGLALLAAFTLSEPIADVRISHDVTDTAISQIETRINLGVIAISYLHSWKSVLP